MYFNLTLALTLVALAGSARDMKIYVLASSWNVYVCYDTTNIMKCC
jgi:hypothetical protein